MRILIADDDIVSRVELQALLARSGHEVVAVAEGSHAWRVREGPYLHAMRARRGSPTPPLPRSRGGD